MHHRRVHWSIQEPHNMPEVTAVAFLRACGHDVRDDDFNITGIAVGAEGGGGPSICR
jgi:hypothetical protein